MDHDDGTVFVLLRGRRPIAELQVLRDDFPRTWCRIHPLPEFEEIRPLLAEGWEAIHGRGGLWPIVRVKLLRLRLRPDYGGPLIRKVLLIPDGDQVVLRYRYGRLATWRLLRQRRRAM